MPSYQFCDGVAGYVSTLTKLDPRRTTRAGLISLRGCHFPVVTLCRLQDPLPQPKMSFLS